MDIERALFKGMKAGVTEPTEIDPIVLANGVLGLLMRSGRPRSDGLGRTVEVEQESGEVMTFTMLASNPLDAHHVARVRVWLADHLCWTLSLTATTITSSRPSTTRHGQACCSQRSSSTKTLRAPQDQTTKANWQGRSAHKITVVRPGTNLWVSYDKRQHSPHLILSDTWSNCIKMTPEVSEFRAEAFQAAIAKVRELGWIT
jgi:hypothetical protein